METAKEVALRTTMLPTYQRPIGKQLSPWVIDLDVSRERLCMVLFIKHDHSAVVLEERLKVEIERHGFCPVEEQSCCRYAVSYVAPAEASRQFCLVKIFTCQQFEGCPCDANNPPTAVLYTHEGSLDRRETSVTEVLWTGLPSIK